MKTYEAMFLMDPALASNWPDAEAEINRILDRAGGKVLGITNWGERKLAYPIGQLKRGLYALSFFEAEPDRVNGLERDVQLSEQAVRLLLIRRDKMTPEMVQTALSAEPPPKVPVRSDEWSARPRSGPPDGRSQFGGPRTDRGRPSFKEADTDELSDDDAPDSAEAE
ncbi:MAG: 30S ribosomal protein S6 [Planctomycetota bacterium]